LREIDLLNAGIVPPPDEQEFRQALIKLSTAGLRAELKAAEANLESVGQELESSRFLESSLVVHSPMSGIAGARHCEEGERLKREDKIFTIIDTHSFYAIFPVPEAEALKLSRGMPATINLDGTGTAYNGVVDLVAPQADIQSFTFLVRVILDADEKGLLKPGMFARIIISMEQPRKIHLIPESSLIDRKDNQGIVFVIRNNMLSERVVQLGQLYGDEREITGLNQGDVVVLHPNMTLKDGTYVAIAGL
jgi:RND family efflux transporter MFP subunit